MHTAKLGSLCLLSSSSTSFSRMPVREGLVESLGKSSKIVATPQIGLLGVKIHENHFVYVYREIMMYANMKKTELDKCKSRVSRTV